MDLAGGLLFALESFERNLLPPIIDDYEILTIDAMKAACTAERRQ